MEIELTKENYDGEVIKSNMPVLVDFWASWCGPCKMVAPIISQIAEEYNGKVKVCKVNVDDQGELAAQNAIVSIPTVILFIDGKPVKKIVGAHSLDDYEDAIDEFIKITYNSYKDAVGDEFGKTIPSIFIRNEYLCTVFI